jgi:DnaJ-domain-containing protein 1
VRQSTGKRGKKYFCRRSLHEWLGGHWREDLGVTGEDLNAVLGVTPAADPEVVHGAYRALARKHHPDKGGSTALMPHINQAYDEVRRRHGRLH